MSEGTAVIQWPTNESVVIDFTSARIKYLQLKQHEKDIYTKMDNLQTELETVMDDMRRLRSDATKAFEIGVFA